jgi:polyphenol oxidase
MPAAPELIAGDWPVPAGVRAFVTTRGFGDIKAPAVRAKLRSLMPADPVWLRQVHGTAVVDASAVAQDVIPEADASFTDSPQVVCAVLAADCLPVLLAARDGTAVAAAHAGWRGLCAGVIERAVGELKRPGDQLTAYLGPAIGPGAYEVGEEVRDAFLLRDAASGSAFSPTRPGHWLLDLYAVARQRLASTGVKDVHGGTHCTYSEPERFFSFRRDQAAQRMAAFIWRV